MHVSLTRRARLSVLRIAQWWRLNGRHAPATFEEEFAEALRLLAQTPLVGAITRSAGRPNLRRVSLKKSRQHLYYRIDDAKQVVTVLEVWHHSRGARPKL